MYKASELVYIGTYISNYRMRPVMGLTAVMVDFGSGDSELHGDSSHFLTEAQLLLTAPVLHISWTLQNSAHRLSVHSSSARPCF